MNNERFTIGETLFSPAIAGIDQAGIPEAIENAISSTGLPEYEQEMFYSNILVIGGNVCLDNFSKRLHTELRSLAPADATLNISVPERYELNLCFSPITCAWEAAADLCNSNPQLVLQQSKSRTEYLEGSRTLFFH